MTKLLKNEKARKALKTLKHAGDAVNAWTGLLAITLFLGSMAFQPFGNRLNTVGDFGVSVALGIVAGALGYVTSYAALDISSAVRHAKKDLEECVKEGSIIIRRVHDGKQSTWRAFDANAHPYDLGAHHDNTNAASATDLGMEIQGFNLLGFLSDRKLQKLSETRPAPAP